MNSTRRLENVHVALWLIKDYSWCTTTRWLGLAMAVTTIALAVAVARASRHSLQDFAHDVAACCWIAANITWMIGEFYFSDGTRRYARGFFYLGLTCIALFYAYELVKQARRALAAKHAV